MIAHSAPAMTIATTTGTEHQTEHPARSIRLLLTPLIKRRAGLGTESRGEDEEGDGAVGMETLRVVTVIRLTLRPVSPEGHSEGDDVYHSRASLEAIEAVWRTMCFPRSATCTTKAAPSLKELRTCFNAYFTVFAFSSAYSVFCFCFAFLSDGPSATITRLLPVQRRPHGAFSFTCPSLLHAV